MRLSCPCCGSRVSEEFAYFGDAAPARPEGGDGSPDAAWIDYVYLRDNPAGRHRDLWFHAAGCRSWLVVTRDTRTHEIFSVEIAQDVARGRRRQTPS
jgi:sarcosine oxidase subunit delta